MNISKYFILALSLASLGSFVAPVQAVTKTRQVAGAQTAEPAESATGARFVISNPIGGSLPSTLYYRDTDGFFYPISVSSRVPSKRLAYPSNGRYYFWDKNPNPAQVLPSAKGKMSSTELAKAKAQQAEVKIPAPYLTVPVNKSAGSRSICILQPRVTEANGKKKQTALATYLSEGSIPKTGQSILNLSRYPMYLDISMKGDYSDKKRVMIKPSPDGKSMDAGNLYSFEGAAGKNIAFILSAKLPSLAEPKRIKASRFVVSKKQVQVAIILNDPNKPTVKMEMVQIMQ